MSAVGPELQPWIGVGYRHIRAGAGHDVLDFRFAGFGENNRWNKAGSPALYLAGDSGIVVAEWGRHLTGNIAPGTPLSSQRVVYRLKVRLDSVMDLRLEHNVEALGFSWSPAWFLDSKVTRSLAEHIRAQGPAQAIIVPSIAFIDDHARWNLVVFLDKVPADTSEWVISTESIGLLQWSGS